MERAPLERKPTSASKPQNHFFSGSNMQFEQVNNPVNPQTINKLPSNKPEEILNPNISHAKLIDEETKTTKIHEDIIKSSLKFSDIYASKVEWTVEDIFKWKFGNKLDADNDYLFKRKAQFTSHYRNVLKDAATKYDIPEFLLAGVAFVEFGGDPVWIDDVADDIRSVDWSGNDWIDNNTTITKNPNLTSFGNISIQVRRASFELGYDPDKMTSNERNSIITSLKNPIQNIFIAAKHLSTLKKVDFENKPSSELTIDDIKIIATRYNRGPNISLIDIKKNLSYGNSIYKHKDEINNALKTF
jgi:hypothetical protein